ncbi:sepiapterin reductase (L-erythro-7,8-dihydrobiopterin forming) [Powellomyces hirtus]|uniref:Sepiapterin reductase n=1 Tax=Powellomyces hirtus TaxID=109895 RepID=A0A507E3F7_9FUNG|nr:sepiapterin reductase (L-erythro-7,8-dihydrobiopterin forming) [Powellomyces hirtus]
MPRTLILLTGASRGFGRSIALSCAKSGLAKGQPLDFLLTARDTGLLGETRSQILALSPSATVVTHAVDFTLPGLDNLCEGLLNMIPHPGSEYTQVYLINNAGSLGKLDRLRHQTAADIAPAIHVNLTAPMALTTAFLRHFANPTQSTIVNISSLAAVTAFDCWGVYCATKAARDMYHKTIAVEEPNVRILNYAPGPLDTDMQTRIRDEMPDVPLREVYIQMHQDQNLVDPAVSAKVLIELLEKDTYENAAHIDVYDVEGWQK